MGARACCCASPRRARCSGAARWWRGPCQTYPPARRAPFVDFTFRADGRVVAAGLPRSAAVSSLLVCLQSYTNKKIDITIYRALGFVRHGVLRLLVLGWLLIALLVVVLSLLVDFLAGRVEAEAHRNREHADECR